LPHRIPSLLTPFEAGVPFYVVYAEHSCVAWQAHHLFGVRIDTFLSFRAFPRVVAANCSALARG
jgi:hypothetical protein